MEDEIIVIDTNDDFETQTMAEIIENETEDYLWY